MNYWLICLPKEDLLHCIKIGTFGLARKHILAQVKEGDKLACLAGKGDWKFLASGQITSDYYVDDAPVFLKSGLFIDRFRFAATPFSKELDLMSIIDQLSFVTKLEYWAVYFRSGITKISEKDWELILK
jgi:EVE domain